MHRRPISETPFPYLATNESVTPCIDPKRGIVELAVRDHSRSQQADKSLNSRRRFALRVLETSQRCATPGTPRILSISTTLTPSKSNSWPPPPARSCSSHTDKRLVIVRTLAIEFFVAYCNDLDNVTQANSNAPIADFLQRS